jgi:hypothetical protein
MLFLSALLRPSELVWWRGYLASMLQLVRCRQSTAAAQRPSACLVPILTPKTPGTRVVLAGRSAPQLVGQLGDNAGRPGKQQDHQTTEVDHAQCFSAHTTGQPDGLTGCPQTMQDTRSGEMCVWFGVI